MFLYLRRIYLNTLMVMCGLISRPLAKLAVYAISLLTYRVRLDRRIVLLDLESGRTTVEKLAAQKEAFEHPGRKVSYVRQS